MRKRPKRPPPRWFMPVVVIGAAIVGALLAWLLAHLP